MKKKTFLFFPVEIGLAHIVKPLTVAEELHARGHRIIFALPKRKHHLFSNSTVKLADIKTYSESDSTIRIKRFTGYEFQQKLIQEELTLIEKYQPDALVVDFRISALAAGLIKHKPMFFLGLGETMPYGCKLPNPGIPSFIHRVMSPFFRFVYYTVLTYYLREIMRLVKEYGIHISWNKWFRSIKWILSEPEFYLPVNKKNLTIAYTGPLSWNGFKNSLPDWFSKINPDGKTVYLTFGGTGFDKKKLVDLSILLVQNNFRVIVSSGSIAKVSDFPIMKNLFVAQFLPGREITKRVDLMICHGGYGTMIEAIHNNTPIIAVPFNPDQIVHGLRMQELGVAQCLFSFSFQDLRSIMKLDWAAIERKGQQLPIETIRNEVQFMLKNISKYKQALKNFNEKYPYKNGAKQAADIIEKTLLGAR